VTDDLDGDSRPSGLNYDIGADEVMCRRTDIDCDCSVDVDDVQMVAGHWRCKVDDTDCNPWYDLDDDGTVTVADIMRVAAEWGWRCSQEP
jgi:hypothetical protein